MLTVRGDSKPKGSAYFDSANAIPAIFYSLLYKDNYVLQDDAGQAINALPDTNQTTKPSKPKRSNWNIDVRFLSKAKTATHSVDEADKNPPKAVKDAMATF